MPNLSYRFSKQLVSSRYVAHGSTLDDITIIIESASRLDRTPHAPDFLIRSPRAGARHIALLTKAPACPCPPIRSWVTAMTSRYALFLLDQRIASPISMPRWPHHFPGFSTLAIASHHATATSRVRFDADYRDFIIFFHFRFFQLAYAY